MAEDVLDRLIRWLSRPSNRASLLVIPYVTGVAAVLSYLIQSGGSGDPTRLQVALLSVAMLAAFLLAFDMVGGGGSRPSRRR